ncbi:MAG: beta-ketoacyl-ACP synthase III [Pedobacter sp.]
MMKRTCITGTGSYLPEKVLTNADLEQLVDTTDEWIWTRTGIRERRIATDGEHTSDLATEAARRAMSMAGVAADEIDLIIVATVTGDFNWPATACLVQSNLQASRAFAFDISAACSGFLYGLSIANSYIQSGTAKKILLIGAEVFSRIVDWKDRGTCILFGDGAGAVVLEAGEEDRGLLSCHLHTDGSCWPLLYQMGQGSRNPADSSTAEAGNPFVQMQGNEVFKVAVRSLCEAGEEALAANDLTASDVDLLIPHQANRRILEATAKRLGVPLEKVMVNVDRVGNTSAASIPIALDEAHRGGRIKTGDVVLLNAFGGGFTWGSALFRW